MLKDLLTSTRRIAVLGFSDKPEKAGHYVPAYLSEQGYQIQGVNPALAGRQVPPSRSVVAASLAELTGPVDMVLVFRRSQDVAGHLQEILAARPASVWMQLGIRHDEVARQLEAAGIQVVQDRCMLLEHRALFTTG